MKSIIRISEPLRDWFIFLRKHIDKFDELVSNPVRFLRGPSCLSVKLPPPPQYHSHYILISFLRSIYQTTTLHFFQVSASDSYVSALGANHQTSSGQNRTRLATGNCIKNHPLHTHTHLLILEHSHTHMHTHTTYSLSKQTDN